MKAFSLVALLAAALFAPGPAQAPAPYPQTPQTRQPPEGQAHEPAGIIRGHVFGFGHRPLFRAQVHLVGVDSGQDVFVTTDETGRYAFTALGPGSYRVSAGKAGYLVIEFGQQTAFEHGTIVDLADGEAVEGIDISLPPSGAIAGRLIDENGDPVEGAMVQLEQVQFVGGRRQLLPVVGVASRTSNDLGHYRLFGIPPGEYVVSAASNLTPSRQATNGPPGYVPIYAPGTPVASEARTVDVGLSQEVNGVDLRFTPIETARITGTALDSIGEPTSGGRFTLFPSERSGSIATAPMTGQVDGQGRFTITNIAPGDYVLQVTGNRVYREEAGQGQVFGPAGGRPVRGDGDEGEFAWNYLTLASADRQEVTVQTLPGSTVTGHVSFEDDPGGVKPAQLGITTVAVNQERSPLVTRRGIAPVQSDWTFALSGLSGPRVFRIARQPAGWALKAVKVNGVDSADIPIEFGARDQSLDDVEVVLTRRISQMSGRVTDSRERPVAGAAIVVFPRDPNRRSRWTRAVKVRRSGQNGTFTVRDLPADDYFVAAIDRLSESTGELFDPEFLESLTGAAAKATVGDGQAISLNLRLIAR